MNRFIAKRGRASWVACLVLLVATACEDGGNVTPAGDPGQANDAWADTSGGDLGRTDDGGLPRDEGSRPDLADATDGVDPGGGADLGNNPDPGDPSDVPGDVGQDEDVPTPPQDVPADLGTDPGTPPDPTCDGLIDANCVQIHRGEAVFFRRPSGFPAFDLTDRGTVRTVIRLHALIDAEVAADPTAWRYQFFGTDNYTFGGYATWEQVLQAYMELGARRIIWEPALELPDSWRVKDTFRIVLSPKGG